MSIFFLKRFKKRNNNANLKPFHTTWDITWAYDSYYNIKTCSPYIDKYSNNVRY